MGKWGIHMGITQRNEDRLEGRLRQHTGWEKTASKPGFNRVPGVEVVSEKRHLQADFY